jgi:putative CocE/NonD family hydrolase
MRDGVVLRADLWRPDRSGSFPTLVYRTPYDRRDAGDDSGIAALALARGYAVLLQDVRGRFGSEGEFDAYRHEGDDGYDTIEWAAAQPWSNGRIGTIGLSYPGAVQWLAATERPPHLLAMVPAMTYATPETFWFGGGVWDGSWLDWTWYNIAPDASRRAGRAPPDTDDSTVARAHGHRPLATLPDLQGLTPWYYEWMRHPPRDPWWSWAALEGHYQDVTAAVINLSGWFDEPYGPFGAATNYTRLVQTGGQSRTRLILGPWTHGVEAVQRTRAGDRDFGRDASIPYASLVLDWMDRFLDSVATSGDTMPPVSVFVMGENRWHRFSTWPPSRMRPDTFYLHHAGKSASPGRLDHQVAAASQPHSRFRSDPMHPLPDPFNGRAGAHDYRALAGRSDALVFETRPLEAPMDLVGPVVAEIAASADVADFDLWLQLYDVAPDSTAWNLAGPGNGLLRASFRDGGPARKLPQRNHPVRLVLDRTITANHFQAGHRLRIVISSSFVPYFSVNPQTGKQEFESSGTRSGTITIHHSAALPSLLILPLLPATTDHVNPPGTP